MSTMLTLDASGGLFVPAALLERAHLLRGKTVAVDVENDRLVLKSIEMQSSPETLEAELVADGNAKVKLVQKGKIQVFTGFDGPFDAVAAVTEARLDRDAKLVPQRNRE